MEKETMPPSLFARISRVQQAVKAAKKTTEGYGYKYATLNDVWELVKKQMAAEKLGWTSTSEASMRVDDGIPTITSILKIYVYADETETNLEQAVEDGNAICSSYMFACTKAQTVGSYETYYRRYALMRMLGVTVTDDDDGAAASGTVETTTHHPRPNVEIFK